jgi:hypothetical protein
MTVQAYVLIQTEVGKAAQVASEVRKIDGVRCAEADTVDELGKMVVSRVQLVEGITRTLTCPVVNL